MLHERGAPTVVLLPIVQIDDERRKRAFQVVSLMNTLKFPGLDPDTVYKLLSTDMSKNEYFTTNQVLRILQNFASIYKNDSVNGAQKVTDAINILLDQGLDAKTTFNLANAFSAYYQLMGQKTVRSVYGHISANPDYKASSQERLQAFDAAIKSLNGTQLNPRTYRSFNSSNHAIHAREMGLTEDEYKQDAIDFLKGAPNGNELQLTRSNGEIVRWNKDTGEFGIVKPNGDVKTYYDEGTNDKAYLYFLTQAVKTGE